jgi:predicted dehydrogenase
VIEGSSVVTTKSQLTYAMVGGGPGAFIGDVHRSAIRLDNKATLVAGVFSSDPAKSREFGQSLHIAQDRLYDNYTQMAIEESKRADGVDFVVIVTPNAFHYPIAKACLSQKLHVVCDKPLTITSAEAIELRDLARKNGLLFGVTYTYTGYPTVKEIRSLINKGVIGDLRFVNAEYPQEWLATRSEDEENRQAKWRTDPKMSGASNCVGDIGSHIENLVATMTNLSIKRVSARLDHFVENRVLDDNASIMVDYDNGAKGLYWTSQIAVGSDNALRVRIYGSKGALVWFQEDPDHFELSLLGEPTRRYTRGRDTFEASSQKFSRLPAGHPEGLFEAFANIYKAFIDSLQKKLNGEEIDLENLEYPTVEQGAEGVKFIEACVQSSLQDSAWVNV